MTQSLRSLVPAILVPMLACFPGTAWSAELKPYKDRLFAYPATLATSDGGAHITVDYNEMRDINARDAVPERRVKPEYIDFAPRRQQQNLKLASAAGEVSHIAVGKQAGAAFIVLYLHGQGGSRKQGMDDLTFGGNFNRIKNLATRNGGLYLTPDFPDFGSGGAARVAALIDHYSAASPGAPVFVACGSMGGALCWLLADNDSVAPKLAGLLILGSHWDDSFAASAAYRRRVPVLFGHGSRDKVFAVEKQEAFFRNVRNSGYPARFVRFEGGTHGTPIRMIDWRDALNWMMANRPVD